MEYIISADQGQKLAQIKRWIPFQNYGPMISRNMKMICSQLPFRRGLSFTGQWTKFGIAYPIPPSEFEVRGGFIEAYDSPDYNLSRPGRILLSRMITGSTWEDLSNPYHRAQKGITYW